jgi:hypothetical protein
MNGDVAESSENFYDSRAAQSAFLNAPKVAFMMILALI